MKKYKIERIENLYDNCLFRGYALPLNSSFSFKIPINKKLPLLSVGLAFATYMQDCLGILYVKIKSDSGVFSYKLNMETIKDNSLVRFEFKDKKQITSFLEIELYTEYRSDKKLALWINDKGTCAIVESLNIRTVEVSDSVYFSILMPVYNTKLEYLKKTIESVKSQIYPHWELCIVDDGSNNLELNKFLKSYNDPRVKIKINKKNKGIALCTNDCLNMASGDFVCFLDHDDLLDGTALIEAAALLEEKPELDLIYTDEDKINENGKRYGAFYKSDWNYTMLLSYMYTCHLSFYRKSILDEIKGLRSGFDGSQDYDLVLRFVEKTDNVGHIPLILYHWRATEDSTARTIANKPEARVNAEKALTEHLKRTSQNAVVEGGKFQGMYEVRFKLKEQPSVTLIIPFKDQLSYLKNLLFTIEKSTYKYCKILLIDNQSKDSIRRELKKLTSKYDFEILKYDESFNYSAINNYAAERAKSKYLLFLNNDTEVLNSDWLEELVCQAERPEVSVVGAKLLYVDHRIQHAGIFIGVNGIAGHGHKNFIDYNPGYYARPHIVQEITAVTGACMLVKRLDFKEVGGFEKKLPTAFNDIDFCLKIRQRGYKVIYTPHARLIHHESKSRGIDKIDDPGFIEMIKYMDKKWGCLSYKDPYYNPNLTRIREDFSIGS